MFLKDQFMPENPRYEDRKINKENQERIVFRISRESPNYDIEFPPLSSSPLPSTSTTTERQKRKQQHSLEIRDEQCEQLKERRPRWEEEDGDLNFFKSVLPHIRNLPLQDKIDYRIKIMKLTRNFIAPNANMSHPTATASSNVKPSSTVNGKRSTQSAYSLDKSINLEFELIL
nr:unnamed protein product [Callosobruchus analis]